MLEGISTCRKLLGMTDTKTRWVTRQEAAKIADVSVSSIDKYMKSGKLTKHKDRRGRVKLDQQEVEALTVPLPQPAVPVQ
jgi:hypothetical protein